MQVYRELSVLTARPGAAEMAAVPHRLFGMVPASEAYSVGRWLADAAAAIAAAKAAGRVPILVGGTGLYFKALLEGLSPIPDIPAETREHWRERSETLGGEGLHRALHPAIPRWRRGSGRPTRSAWSARSKSSRPPACRSPNGREPPARPRLQSDAVHQARDRAGARAALPGIDARFERMIERGAIDEVRALRRAAPRSRAARDAGRRRARAWRLSGSAPRPWSRPPPRRRPRPALCQTADDLAEALHGGLGLGPRRADTAVAAAAATP